MRGALEKVQKGFAVFLVLLQGDGAVLVEAHDRFTGQDKVRPAVFPHPDHVAGAEGVVQHRRLPPALPHPLRLHGSLNGNHRRRRRVTRCGGCKTGKTYGGNETPSKHGDRTV